MHIIPLKGNVAYLMAAKSGGGGSYCFIDIDNSIADCAPAKLTHPQG